MTETKIEYATFNRRVFASTIDSVLLIFVLFFFNYPVSYIIYDGGTFNDLLLKIQGEYPNLETMGYEELMDVATRYHLIARIILAQFATFIISFACLAYFWFKFDNTPGKWLTECKIVDAETLESPSRKQYIVRGLSYVISALPFCLGFIAIYWDKKNRAWHDNIAGTVVIIKPHPWPSLEEIVDMIKNLFTKKA